MGSLVPLFRSTMGLNNRVDPVRIHYDAGTGVVDLSVAVNVDIDDTGRISRRKGHTQVLAVDQPHSLFYGGTDTLFVYGDALSVLGKDNTSHPIRNVTADARMAYAQVGNRVYYSNGREKGYVEQGVSKSWMRNPVYPAPPDYSESEKSIQNFYDPPVGKILHYYSGRMFVAQGPTVWYSEPWYLEYFRLGSSHMTFNGQVSMIRQVYDGLYVSDEQSVWFVQGGSPREFVPRVVSDCPAIFGTDVHAERILQDGTVMQSILWTSPKGICEGLPSGTVRNLTASRLDLTRTPYGYPLANSGCAYWWNGKYVSLLNA